MHNQIVLDRHPDRQIVVETLHARCVRLERLSVALLVALVLSLVTTPSAPASVAPSSNALREGNHGSYCALETGELVFFANHRAETPSLRQFHRFCENSGGESLWRP